MAPVSRRKRANSAKDRGRVDTRSKLIETAGVMFAEYGFNGATAKDIAKLADTNAASVNYHFGGIEGLYEEVLLHARRRFIDDQQLIEALAANDDPVERLRNFYAFVIKKVLTPASSWNIRIIIREFVSPSYALEKLLDQDGQPRVSFLALIGSLVDLPPGHPLFARVMFNVSTPCLMLLLADQRVINQMFPGLLEGPRGEEALADHLTQFALAGIQAVMAGHGKAKAQAKKPAKRAS